MNLLILTAICSFNCLVLTDDAQLYRVNVAKLKNHTSSNLEMHGHSPGLGVDGYLDTCLYIQPDPIIDNSSWWQIDLKINYKIALVRMLYTNDSRNAVDLLRVYVRDNSEVSHSCSYANKSMDFDYELKYDFPCYGTIGKVVRLEHHSMFNICEVQVFAVLESVNLAYDRPISHVGLIVANQSGMVNDGVYTSCTTLKSYEIRDAWLYVKLDSLYYVTHINIFYLKIHKGIQLFVSNNDVNQESHLCATTHTPKITEGIPHSNMTLECSKPIPGRYVMLKNDKETEVYIVVLCELEVYTKGFPKEMAKEQPMSCLPHEYKCLHGDCIHKDWLCDGTNDCPHADDEAPSCQGDKDQFKCKRTNQTIPKVNRCDGIWQCSDYSDEEFCFDFHTKPMIATFNGESSYYVCSDGWLKIFSIKICKDYNRDFGETYKIPVTDLEKHSILKLTIDIMNIRPNDIRNISSMWANSTSCDSGMYIGVRCDVKRALLHTCGKRALANVFFGPYILSGQHALPGAWPWHVKVIISDGFLSSFDCAGSIINSLWILTAAHCFDGNKFPKDIYIEAGSILSTNLLQPYRITHIIKHPDYRKLDKSNYAINDIALLKLAVNIRFSNFIKPICLPDKVMDDRILTSFRHCVMAGFGHTDRDGTLSRLLQQARMNLITDEDCGDHFNFLNSTLKSIHHVTTDFLEENSLMCAGQIPLEDGKNYCTGDSGGALVCETSTGQWMQVGVATHGARTKHDDTCTNSIFARVDHYLDFIHSEMEYYNNCCTNISNTI